MRTKLLKLLFLLLPLYSAAQTTYLPPGDKSYIFLERWEIKQKNDSLLNFSKTRPLSRMELTEKAVAKFREENQQLSKTDRYNLRSFLLNNIEYIKDDQLVLQLKSKKPFLKKAYHTPANMYEVHIPDFDLVINPAIQLTVSSERDNDETLYYNSRGLTLRGHIAKKIGFYAYVTDNQEKDPIYVRQLVNARKAVPGAGFYKPFKLTGYDYFDAQGYFTTGAGKHVNISFGYDRHFIGNGDRSLFLGNHGTANLFLKLNTRFWKLNYQNLFVELHSAGISGGDILIPKKYAAIHHLDFAVTKWLNVGLFEATVFKNKDKFSVGYLNPIILTRTISDLSGSNHNSMVGIELKANLAKRFQVYSQLLIDKSREVNKTGEDGYWGDKWAWQVGLKYIDAFNISNLDLFVEHNRVRPFTYSYSDSVANYSNYNQPLAHPLGANFKEIIGTIRYQPAPKWMIIPKVIYYTQGRDSNNRSFGSNIILSNQPPVRMGDYGYSIGSGWETHITYASLLLSYELMQNFFLEFNTVYRKQETKTAPISSSDTFIMTFGFRWNMWQRKFDY